MKHLHFAAIALAAASLCATGCKMATPNPSDATARGFAVDTIAYDSTMGNAIKCSITVSYPTGDDSLAMGTRSFIAGELASLYLPTSDTDDTASAAKYPAYSGSASDGKLLVGYYGDGTVSYLNEAREAWKGAYNDGRDMPTLSLQTTIGVEAATPAYITYRIVSDSYLGGAHPSRTLYCKNISRLTNRPVDNVVDAKRLGDLQPLLRKGALRCLKACGIDNVADSTLADYLILPDDGLIPLPAHSAWIDNDSLKFCYQPYEIASYAVGAISFGIAAKDIKPYLSEEAKELLGL